MFMCRKLKRLDLLHFRETLIDEQINVCTIKKFNVKRFTLKIKQIYLIIFISVIY